MSSIWTPSGERPVGPEPASPQPAPPQPPRQGPGPGDEAPLSEAELQAQMAEMQRELADTRASVVVVNHCIGFFQLAVLYLNQQPPKLEDAQLAIDALAGVVEGLGSRLGEDAAALQEALRSVRLAFVQAKQGPPE